MLNIPGNAQLLQQGDGLDRQPNFPAKPPPLGRMRSLCQRFQAKKRQIVQRVCETYQAIAQLLQQGDGLDGQPNGRLGLGALGCTCTLRRLLLFSQLLRQTQLPPPLFPVLLCRNVPRMMSLKGGIHFRCCAKAVSAEPRKHKQHRPGHHSAFPCWALPLQPLLPTAITQRHRQPQSGAGWAVGRLTELEAGSSRAHRPPPASCAGAPPHRAPGGRCDQL